MCLARDVQAGGQEPRRTRPGGVAAWLKSTRCRGLVRNQLSSCAISSQWPDSLSNDPGRIEFESANS